MIHELFFWGMVGLTTEVVFTATRKLIFEKKVNLIGHTSVWMFPIYALGLTYGVEVLTSIVKNDILRLLTYPLVIWAVEIIVGYPAAKAGIRVWDYRYLPNKMHWKGIFSYVHFPLWIVFGIIIEALHRHAG